MRTLLPLIAMLLALAGPAGAQEQPGWDSLMMVHAYTASSTLGGDDPFAEQPSRYAARNMGDGDPATCWAEGAAGRGLGERVHILLDGSPAALSAVNGYAKSRSTFAGNGRVKAFTATLLHAFNLPGDVTEVATLYHCRPFPRRPVIGLDDTAAPQSLPFPFDWDAVREDAALARVRFEADLGDEIVRRREGAAAFAIAQAVILRLEIADVYPGTKYDDTCVSELTFQ
ncbi:MAG: hypothetical protein MUF78_06855 [Candidatus Edwardsbacteria bacterium]|jgi:hypothetical protein|nr:hypothetical protein [Candidatus Edwardsbacteria bacterium]